MFPEMFSNPWMAGWNGFWEMQRKWTDLMVGISEKAPRPEFPNPAMGIFEPWFQIYEQEFRALSNLPALGLTRFHQERFREALEKYQLLQQKTIQFLASLSKPIEKSFSGAQEKLAELLQEGRLSQDPRDYYRIWIKTLEGYYLSFLRSGEYMEAMNEALNALEDFLQARQKVFQAGLQMLSIPTNGDLDDLSKEFYSLKKRVRELEKQMNHREEPAI